ncbi:hypothetical protein FAIPA1_50235 [Frankia sp. AiPs1]
MLLEDLRLAAGFTRYVSLSVMIFGGGVAPGARGCRFYRIFCPICLDGRTGSSPARPRAAPCLARGAVSGRGAGLPARLSLPRGAVLDRDTVSGRRPVGT